MTTNQQIKQLVDTHISTHMIKDITQIIVSYIANDIDEMIDYILNWVAVNNNITQSLIIRRDKFITHRMSIKHNTDIVNLFAFDNFRIDFDYMPSGRTVNHMKYYDIYAILRKQYASERGSKYICDFICFLVKDFNKRYAMFIKDPDEE